MTMDEAFILWRDSKPAGEWAQFDLSAAKLGFSAGWEAKTGAVTADVLKRWLELVDTIVIGPEPDEALELLQDAMHTALNVEEG